MKTIKLLLRSSHLVVFFLLVQLAVTGTSTSCPVDFVDSGGNRIILPERPRKVVSLVPAITEIIFQLGAGESLAGLTLHDRLPPEAGRKRVVGGFLAPSKAQIEAIRPDVIFVSSAHRRERTEFVGQSCCTIELDSHSIEDLYRNIRLLGVVFNRGAAAEEIIWNMQNELQLITRKVGKIPANRRKRVARFTALDLNRIMVPGDDSFHNDLIRAAGGIPPELGRKGNAVGMTMEEWRRFNPQVIYGCGGNRGEAERFFSQPGWNDVEAVREGKICCFPCDLTCRLSVHTADFAAWLAATIYDDEFAAGRNRVLEEKHVRTKPLELPLDYVRSARVDETTIYDFPNKTLVIEFKAPMRVTSTLEGERRGILTVGNHYFPPPCWSLAHRLGLERWKNHTLRVIGKSQKTGSFLFTGADMGNLSVQKARFRDMTVYALVTAGVEGNALRTSVDEGLFYEPGTINVVLLTNMRLTTRARTRAIITATEAKTAAMQDLDIRSASRPGFLQATGTGTDEVLVIEGLGTPIDNAGGHCRMGELIARAVYNGVKEAVCRQNGITTPRSVFQRLQERNIDLYGLIQKYGGLSDIGDSGQCLRRIEEVLLQPRCASFVESAFALSDAYERGQISNLEAVQLWCRNMFRDIAGIDAEPAAIYSLPDDTPIVMKMAVNALLNALVTKEKKETTPVD